MKKIIVLTCMLFVATAAIQAADVALIGDWDGFFGDGDPLLVESSGGELMMQSGTNSYEPGNMDKSGDGNPDYGPFMYVNVTGDFSAITKANSVDTPYHHAAGIMALNEDLSSGLNFVQGAFFPVWTGHLAWNCVDDARSDGGNTGDSALASKYMKMERVGSLFTLTLSEDGTVWDPWVEWDRPDLPATMQVGLWQALYESNVGTATFDFFELTQGGSTVINDDFSVDHTYATPEPATMLLLGLGAFVIRRRK